jgi:virginiamycin B lyase
MRTRTGAVLMVLALVTGGPVVAGSADAAPGVTTSVPPITYTFVGTGSSRPFWITPGPDGNLWFTDTDASAVGRITPAGTVTEFKVGKGKRPYAIVAAADGNLWFTEMAVDKIGVVDVAGNLIHEYAIPGVEPHPAGITAAPDGSVWFTEMGTGENITDAVGRITLDGQIESFELYSCACFPVGITTGPDGNLWATEELGVYGGYVPGTVDRISPDGSTIDRFPIPVDQDQPGHLPGLIAPGPDGRLWFSEYAADVHRLGRIDTAGKIREVDLPGTVTNSVGVATGADGKIWVTQGDAGDVLVLTSTGMVTTTIPTHPSPAVIAVGVDGNLWFTVPGNAEIARIDVARPGSATILDIAPGFTPAARTVDLGTQMTWVMEAPGTHQVHELDGLDLFGSAAAVPVSLVRHRFTAAGTYRYDDPDFGESGVVAVPAKVPATASVGTPFSVAWATADGPAGMVFDAQIRLPGATTWTAWQTGATSHSHSYTAAASGSYQFRARLRRLDTGAASGWSPAVSVNVG